MKHLVFISHSSKDKQIAQKVCLFLEAKGVSCWIAPRDVTPGRNYGAAIVDAIDECGVFVLILTQESNKSGQVVREVERAAASNDVIIPFRVDPVQPSRDLEFYVSTTHWLDASSGPLEKHLNELLKAITNWQQAGTLPVEPGPPGPASPAPASAPPSSKSRTGPLLAAGIVLLILLGGIFAYQTSRTRRPKTPGPNQTPSVAPAIAPEPSASVSLQTETPAPTPSIAFSPETLPSAPVSETPEPTSALRLHPGEPFHPTPSPGEPAVFSPSEPSVRLRPGQPIKPGPEASAPSLSTAPAAVVPGVHEIAASSQMKLGGVTHRPHLAFDGNRATAWIPKGDGVDQSVSVHFKTAPTISSVSILNSTATDMTDYRNNNRVHTMRMILSDGTTQLLTLEDKMNWQHFKLGKPTTVSWIKFDIVTVFSSKKNHHTPIAEIAFNREDSN